MTEESETREVTVDYSSFPESLLSDWGRFFSSWDGKNGEGVFSHGQLFPLQRPREMRRMLEIARSVSPRVVMEVGCDKGGSLLQWCLLPTVERVVGCEARGTPYNRLFEGAFPRTDFLWIEGSSYHWRSVEMVRAYLGDDRIAVLFLDGDKGAFDRDFAKYLPLMREDGVVFFHDINEPGNSLDTFSKVEREGRFRTERIIDIGDSLEAMATETRGLSPSSPHEHWLRHWKGASAGVGAVFMGGKG